ncbi:rRNA maturation RNase YbeY [bacterium]|nr:rRNA maturation RNase YbeY [bacterium]
MDSEDDPDSIVFNEQAELVFRDGQVLTSLHTLLDYLGLHRVEIGINLVSAEEMRRYNREYRNLDASTDILTFALLEEADGPITPESFPDRLALARKQGEDPVLLGDIIISADEIQPHQAENVKHTLQLLIHGIVHLMGYDHEREDDQGRMAEVEHRCFSVLFGGVTS